MEENRVCKLNVEYYKRSTVCCVIFLSFLAFLISVVLAATLSPDIIESPYLEYDICNGENGYMCFEQHKPVNQFYFKVKLSRHNQFLYIQADFNSSETIKKDLNYSLTIVTDNQEKVLIGKETNRSFHLMCSQETCNSLLLFYIPYIEYEQYIVRFSVFGGLPVSSMYLSIKYITIEFTNFFLIVKYFFLALSIIAIIFFIRSLVRVNFRYWSRQSKIIALMLVSLFFFNEPFLAATLKKLSVEWSCVSVLCNTQFVAFLIIFCFMILHNDYSQKNWTIALVFESVLIFIFFVLLCSVYMFTTVQFKYDPSFNWENDFPDWQKKIYITVLVFLGLFALWAVFLIGYSVVRLKSRTLRDQVLTLTLYGIIVTSLVLIGTGAFQPLPRSGSILLSTMSLYNSYFITLSWLYSPNKMSYDQLMINKEEDNSKKEADNTVIISPQKNNNRI